MGTSHIQHRHDEGIDIYHFNRVTRDALDEFFTFIDPIYAKHIQAYQDKVPLCYVMDLTDSGMFPVKHVMERAVKLIGQYEYQPVHYIAYVIANTQDVMLINILKQLTARNLSHTRKVFKPEQLDEAIAWLKEVRGTFIKDEV